ncbi:alpha/beta hydrolase [Aureococcus anophagefferens]|nr:alpha/beta hydrolase [Aureococcus anophagefferens]
MATKADLRYVAKPASDASGKVASPIVYPRSLYPEVEPFASGHLAVGSGHEIYYEECGNKAGIPAVFLHGGPGAGCDARSRRFFDPAVFRIVVFDQRGSGRSRPNAADDLAGRSPRTSRADPLTAYWDLLTGADADARNAAAAAFVGYELSLSKCFIDPAIIESVLSTPSVLIPFAVMEVHYMRGAGFMERGQLLRDAKKMADAGHLLSTTSTVFDVSTASSATSPRFAASRASTAACRAIREEAGGVVRPSRGPAEDLADEERHAVGEHARGGGDELVEGHQVQVARRRAAGDVRRGEPEERDDGEQEPVLAEVEEGLAVLAGLVRELGEAEDVGEAAGGADGVGADVGVAA